MEHQVANLLLAHKENVAYQLRNGSKLRRTRLQSKEHQTNIFVLNLARQNKIKEEQR